LEKLPHFLPILLPGLSATLAIALPREFKRHAVKNERNRSLGFFDPHRQGYNRWKPLEHACCDGFRQAFNSVKASGVPMS
jgi:hypothetical protein